MKHIWWGTITVVITLITAWTALTIAGFPAKAHEAIGYLWAPLLVGGTMLVMGLFGGALDD